MLLAIDTATRFISLALHDGDTVLMEQTWQSDNQHTVQLAPAVANILDTCQTTAEALLAVAVTIGPGSYTGLRIGVAMAKGLCATNALPLVGMTTLDLLAYAQPHQSNTGLVTVVQAGRGRIIVNSYRWKRGRWQSHAEPRLMTWDALMETIDGAALISGEVNDIGREAIAQAIANGKTIGIASPAHRLRRAGFLAEYAWETLRATDDVTLFSPDKLLPIYLQDETQ